MQGKFITLEGGEGVGKSTQARRIKEELGRRGIEVVLVREPGGTPLAEEIRRLLKDYSADAPNARAELMLFLAARAQLVENVIKPALAAGKWVVSDRFSDSTIAYQGYGRGLDVDAIRRLDAFARGGLSPDLTLLFSVDAQEALRRRRGREIATSTSADRFERAGDDFHARLERGFDAIAAAEPDRVKRIDASGSPDDVWAKVAKEIFDLRFFDFSI